MLKYEFATSKKLPKVPPYATYLKPYLSPPQKETMDSLWYGTCYYMQGLYFYGRSCAELVL